MARKRYDIRVSSEARDPLSVDGIANVLLDFLAQQLEACTGSDGGMQRALLLCAADQRRGRRGPMDRRLMSSP
ncbi:hypothetical protein L0U85_07480 [Glycomyces sp. L485]|uniref:hypothetical protein n=1 Tax=Glycomyces sp. L485 TaxID=2909235 RepID=UPI001F4B2ABE|nr:hypothetical protein [Glycomyces sp. L485]MCH7230690.1 hypothetical protein [Glycomyces sp. L485]